MLEIVKKTDIDFMGKRHIAFGVSSVLVLLGLLALVQIGRGAANLGIDFAGGTAVQLQFEHAIGIEQARQALGKHGLHEAEIQEFTKDHTLLIRVKTDDTLEKKIAGKIVQVFEREFQHNKFVIDSSTAIGPTIGRRLQQDALLAIIISLIGILFYVTTRFELRFGVAAAIATFHDVLAVLGIYYMLDKEITILVVTALLTLAGYSLTDSVVVFDRIRENLLARRRDATASIINNGINQVLSRTLVTTMTVVLVLVPLTMFGGEVLHDFSLALLLGVLIGTYSSVFVASPLLFVLPGGKGKLLSRGS